ncbi:hypothetical protein [Helicobacter sp.]|uniref:beta strand repeat-containing protein n=1 Tax=Helicobacter sp. TaxID=218 RepID=UPI002A91EA79|nr:hypothetical protein [Helicobacter sp.]MDY5557122.1 hypothetical protein [Helicobacter sp.]
MIAKHRYAGLKPKFISVVTIVSLGFVSGTMAQTSALPPTLKDSTLAELQDKILNQINGSKNTTSNNTNIDNPPNILNALSPLSTTPQTTNASKARIMARAAGGDWSNNTTLTYDTTKGEISGTYSGDGALASDGSNKDLTITQGTSATKTGGSQSIIEVKKDSNNKTSSIQNFTNHGTLATTSQVAMWVQQGSSITNFTNSDTGEIKANAAMGVLADGSIENFKNSGTIASQSNYAIISGFKGTIVNFDNTGTITANANTISGVFENFKNSGTITARGGDHAVFLFATKDFDNTGTITANADTIYGVFENFKNFGTITANTNTISGVFENFKNSGTITAQTGNAVNLDTGKTITTFNNTGTITTNTGTAINAKGTIKNFVADTDSYIYGTKNVLHIEEGIENLTLKGTLKVGSGGGSAVYLKSGAKAMDKLHIDGGKIVGVDSANTGLLLLESPVDTILIDNNAVIGKLKEASKDKTSGITFNDIETGSGQGIHLKNSVGSIAIKGNGTYVEGIKAESSHAKINSINIEYGATARTISTSNQSTIGNIALNNGSIDSITNDTGSQINGITLNNGSIDSITNTGASTIGDIAIHSGSIKTITNTGNSTLNGNITTHNHSTLMRVNNAKGSTIQGGIIHGGSGTLEVNSQGIIKGQGGTHLGNTGSGKMVVKNVVVSTDNTHHIKGNKEVYFDLVTIDIDNKAIPATINDILNGDYDLCKISSIKDSIGDDYGQWLQSCQSISGGSKADNVFDLVIDENGNIASSLNLDNLNTTGSSMSIIAGNLRITNFANNVATTSLMNLQNTFNHSTHFYNAYNEKSISQNAHYANLGTDIMRQIPLDYAENLDSLYFNRAIYVLPYFSNEEVKVGNGHKMNAHAIGIIGGYSHITPENNLYSVYLGFERDDVDSKDNHFQTNVASKTFYGGFKMLQYLTNLSENMELYAHYDASAGLRNNHLTSYSYATTSDASPKSYFYNAGVDLGVNYLYGRNIITHKIGLGYEGGAIAGYDLNLAKTKIDGQDFNFLHARASVLWSRAWNPKFHTYLEGGLKYVLNPELNLTGSYVVGNQRMGAYQNMDLNRWSEFINVGIYVLFSDSFMFNAIYTENFSDNTKGHSGYFKFGYLF